MVILFHLEDFTGQRLALSDEAFTLARTITTLGINFNKPLPSNFFSYCHMNLYFQSKDLAISIMLIYLFRSTSLRPHIKYEYLNQESE